MPNKLLVVGVTVLLVSTIFGWFLLGPQSYDVIIAGAGAAGLSAAIEADNAGASVLVIEKMPAAGGNTRRATGGMNAAGTDVQRRMGISDSPAALRQDTLKSGHRKNNASLVQILVDQADDAVDWLIDHGSDLEDVGYLAGHTRPRTHRPTGGAPVGLEILTTLKNLLDRRGIELLLETELQEVILTRQRVSGVRVRSKSGRVYRINARAVVIATGGFGGSPRVFVRYRHDLEGFNTTNHPGATGDYIAIAEAVGARLIDMEQIQTHPTVEPDHGILITEALRGNGGILVDGMGRRFTDELAFRDVLSAAILEQRQGVAYLIFDDGVRRSLKAAEFYIGRRLVRRGEDPEELAQLLNIDGPILTETVAEYNQSILAGDPDEFARHEGRIALDTPPYYGIKVSPGVHYCMGGLMIDPKARVLSEENSAPIPGLFAAGEATGGIHGWNRLGGNSMTDAVVFGRIAGREAALSSRR